MTPTFQPRTPPHRRKHAELAPPSGPPALEALSVQRETDNTCIWTFSRTIVNPPDPPGPGDPAGFIAGGDIAAAINWISGNQMSLWYADPISPGDPWSVDPEEITIQFDPAGTLEPQSGLIT